MERRKKRLQRFILYVALFICTATSRLILPQAQKSGNETPPALSRTDKEQVREVLRLQQTLGDEIWPGFSRAAIPIILFNKKWEYLLSTKNAPPPWRQIIGDDFFGQPYLARPAIDPECFAVLVGDKWAGSCGTLSYMNSRTPLKLPPDFYVSALIHEMFHAFQASQCPERFHRALKFYLLEKEYPFTDEAFKTAWNLEGALLAKALNAVTEESAREQAKQFLSLRQKRRQTAKLTVDLVGFECELEWLEGLAKYAEIRFYELAAVAKGTTPNNPFHFWDKVRLENSLGAEEGDMRFYLSGYAQARLLDRLIPGWKSNKKSLHTTLEKLLTAALGMGAALSFADL